MEQLEIDDNHVAKRGAGGCDDISSFVSKGDDESNCVESAIKSFRSLQDDTVEFEAVRNTTGPTNCNWVAKKVKIGKSDKTIGGKAL